MEPLDHAGLLQRVLPDLPPVARQGLLHLLTRAPTVATLESRVDWLEELVVWVRTADVGEVPADASVASGSRGAALWTLVHLLEREAALAREVAALVARVLQSADLVDLLHQVGLARDPRLVGEAVQRLLRKGLPQSANDADLSVLLERLFPDEASTRWLEETPPKVVLGLHEALVGTEHGAAIQRRLLEDGVQAVVMLAVAAGALGLHADIRSRGPRESIVGLPFARLPVEAQALAQCALSSDRGALRASQARMLSLLEEGARWAKAAEGNLEQGGVSIDLVYRIDLLDRTLDRLGRLVSLLDRGPEDGPDTVRLLRDLVRSSLADRSVLALFAQNSQLLARRLVERAGETGEHYITSTSAEWMEMTRSAAGGGAFTALTAALKVAIVGLHLPVLWEFLACWVNYSGSFLVLQAGHFTLATKQPAMTAATIAAQLVEGEDRVDAIAELIARTARSQFAAALGNLGAVIPASLVLHGLWLWATGHTFMSAEKAHHVIEGLHPLHSGSVPFAMLTGVVLWFGATMGGAVENWSAVQHLPERLAGSRRLRRVLGVERATALSHSFAKNISGWATNVALGALLALVPVVGFLLGLPLDVRHVTLAMGQLTVALATEGPTAWMHASTSAALLGVVVVLAMNFAISFAMAISVAVRARGVTDTQVRQAMLVVLRRALAHPVRFLAPPRESASPLASGGPASGPPSGQPPSGPSGSVPP